MNFLLISHGPMAKASLESAEMILGKQENVKTLEVTHDTTLEGMVSEIREAYHAFNQSELIIFCDILGGTPSNASLRFINEQSDVSVITGFNLPTLIEAFMSAQRTKTELLQIIKETYQNGMVEMTLSVTEANTQDQLLEEIEL